MLLKHPEADRDNNLDDKPLILGGHEQRAANSKSGGSGKLILFLVNLATLAWLGGITLYVENNIGWSNLWSMLPHEIGAFFAGVFGPLAFLWI